MKGMHWLCLMDSIFYSYYYESRLLQDIELLLALQVCYKLQGTENEVSQSYIFPSLGIEAQGTKTAFYLYT